jgi:hypothetical protein
MQEIKKLNKLLSKYVDEGFFQVFNGKLISIKKFIMENMA